MASPIKHILVIGASGNLGRHITAALIEAHYNVSVLTRFSSSAVFAEDIEVHQTDYSTPSLTAAFKDVDVISAVPWFSATLQISIIDCAIAAGVKRFVPSAFGLDDASPHVLEYVPIIRGKVETQDYLQSKEATGLTWNLPARQVTISDGGDVEYEASTMPQVGKAIVQIISPDNFEKTANSFVYINSYTLTQNKVLSMLEKLTGDKFEMNLSTARSLTKDGLAAYDSGQAHSGDTIASGNIITGAFYGNGGLNNCSKSPGLWNERLGLPQEDLETVLVAILRLRNDILQYDE